MPWLRLPQMRKERHHHGILVSGTVAYAQSPGLHKMGERRPISVRHRHLSRPCITPDATRAKQTEIPALAVHRNLRQEKGAGRVALGVESETQRTAKRHGCATLAFHGSRGVIHPSRE